MPSHARDPLGALAALGAGALVALSLPPWGWWPLAIVGIVLLDRLVADRPRRSRFARALCFGAGWFAPGIGWMWFLTAPGYLFAVALFATLVGSAAAVAPAGRWRWLGLPAAITLVEAVRFSFPFGGVPLASLAISQVAGPLAWVVRLGGPLLLTWVTLSVGVAVSIALDRRWAVVLPVAAAVVGVLGLALVVPHGHDLEPVTIALVQGGGPQGTRAIHTDPREVVERHLAATRAFDGAVDLVVWPENVIDVDDFASSAERQEVAAEARRLGVPFAVGITEDVGRRFTNAQVVVLPDGSLPSRYDKVRRVPFGEYVPLRGLLEGLGLPVDQIPRDAVPGRDPAVIDTPVGRFGVVISWEVFFGGRARDGIGHGGTVLLNPTNGSSYTGSVLQSQQVASSRLRALENGRWVAQVSPTGFTAFVSPTGVVHDRTDVSEQAVRVRTIQRRSGLTPYTRVGDAPVIVAATLALAAALALTARDRSRERADERVLVTPPAAR